LLTACPSDDRAGGPAAFAGRSQTQFDLPLERPLPGDAADGERHLAQARQLVGMRRLAEAAYALDVALAADPASFEALSMQGNVLLMPGPQREPTRALKCFRLARMLDPEDPSALLQEAYCRTVLQDDARAKELFAQFEAQVALTGHELSPARQALRARGLGELALRAGQFEAALDHFDAALRVAPEEARIMFQRTEVLERLGRLEDAERQLVAAIARRPEEPQYHFLRALLLRRLGRPDEAARERRIYELLVPFQEDVSRRFAEDHTERLRLRRELVEVYPAFDRAVFLLVTELLEAGELAEAEGMLRGVLAEQPDHAEARYLLAKAQARGGDFAAAHETAESMREAGAPEPAYQALLREISRMEAAAGAPPDGSGRE
jgi:tetratricopeptide (TPR) repeat protein